jgi:hypothetical protein
MRFHSISSSHSQCFWQLEVQSMGHSRWESLCGMALVRVQGGQRTLGSQVKAQGVRKSGKGTERKGVCVCVCVLTREMGGRGG